MAAGTIPAVGSDLGPCEDRCAHIDCETNRSMASARCEYCGEKIGYEIRFYDETPSPDHPHQLVHARCIEVA